MNRKILLLLVLFFGFNCNAQAPEISGDTMMCPYTNGTATIIGGPQYDTYQWFYKYWFTSDDFEAITGANGPSFTYDWYTYDQALLKVVVTLNGTTYESNTIQIDSYAWSSMFVMYELGDNAYFDSDTETIMLCNGASFEISINDPPYDSSITWYKDGVAIADANDSSYLISQAGTYQVSAAPSFCPNSLSNSLPITVAIDPNCSLQTPDVTAASISIYPNPAIDKISIGHGNHIRNYEIIDIGGKSIQSGAFENDHYQIDLNAIESGIYILKLSDGRSASTHKIIKQ